MWQVPGANPPPRRWVGGVGEGQGGVWGVLGLGVLGIGVSDAHSKWTRNCYEGYARYAFCLLRRPCLLPPSPTHWKGPLVPSPHSLTPMVGAHRAIGG